MEPKPFVLGTEFAAARAAEQARLATTSPGPSPLSGSAYDPERDEFNLITVVQTPLDLKVERLVTAWQGSGAPNRDAMRRSLSLEDNYTLIHFAKRMAVEALNRASPEPCEHGLMALAMIDDSRIDPRDASFAAGLLNHATRASSNRSANPFERAIAMATPGMGELLRQSEGSTLEDWGYCERTTSKGIGLIQSGWARYNPTVDLADVAARVGARVLVDRYVVEIKIATELPPIWFDKTRRKHAEETLEGSLGMAAIRGTLRRAFGEHPSQMLMVWIAEMPSADDSVQLLADVGNGVAHEGRYAVGVSAGCLFALVVAGSFQQGVEPYESLSALTDLADETRAVLSDSAKCSSA
jgi:hypothetical protein